jgi:DNA-3-methyladenine glycosylase II
MGFNEPNGVPDWSTAVRLLRKDPVMRGVIKAVGPCSLAPRKDPFVALTKSIFSQQISTTIAAILYERFANLHPRKRPTPKSTIELLTNGSEEQLRQAGLSKQKRAYVLDLARHFADGRIPVRRFAKMGDEEITQALLPVKGVGRWTTEMFLIFVLNRPDVFPVDDLGVQKGIQKFYGLEKLPTKDEMNRIAEPWRPWRTVATWYLWRGQGEAVLKKEKVTG